MRNYQENLTSPLAEILRPTTFDDLIGHETLRGAGGVLERYRTSQRPIALVLYGPPGSSKTTIARILAKETGATVLEFTGSTFGVADIKKAIDSTAAARSSLFGTRVICFVDEIHRLSKVQQDALLSPLESGALEVIAATTENPAFSLSRALLSRMITLQLQAMEAPQTIEVLKRAQNHLENPLCDEVLAKIANAANGDLRIAISMAELVSLVAPGDQIRRFEEFEKQLFGFKVSINADSHYELASALIKSMRAGNEAGALEYLIRSLELGEDPRFIARRIVIFASEDIGLADTKALLLAVAGLNAVESIGMPEAKITLSHLVSYMTRAPKSRSAIDNLKSFSTTVNHNKAVPPELAGTKAKIEEDLVARRRLFRE